MNSAASGGGKSPEGGGAKRVNDSLLQMKLLPASGDARSAAALGLVALVFTASALGAAAAVWRRGRR